MVGQLLQVLEQRATRAMHHALGKAGGTGGIHDVHRMVEREPLEAQGGARVWSEELIP